MQNSGAIPKGKGARPKTKIVIDGISKKDKYEEFSARSNSMKSNRIIFNGTKIDEDKVSRTIGSKNSVNKLDPNSVNKYDLYSTSTFHDINVKPEPLEKRETLITDEGVQYKRLSLSPEWVEKRLFLHYTHPPVPTIEGEHVVGAMDAWTEQMEFLVEDLSWLLKLPHHRFWSQMVYDKSVQECLQFYLMNGPRWYDKVPEDESSLSVISDVHQLTFLIYVRMATHKESKEDYITPPVFGELIYNNFLYDVCKILDLCILYGASNQPLLEKMINNIFTHQQKYFGDLKMKKKNEDYITPPVFGELIYNNFLYDVCKILDLCILYGASNQPLLEKMINNIFTHQQKYFGDLAELSLSLNNVLKNLEEKLGIFDFVIPSSLNSETKLSGEELNDLISYLLDTCCSLQAFLTIFPKACHTFHEKEFELKLSCFYEKAIPKLIEQIIYYGKEEAEQLLRKVKNIRMSCLYIFREILSWVCLQENAQDSIKCSLSQNIESFTHILTTCVEEKIFITDYNTTFDIRKDLSYFEEKGADMTTLDFIREAVDSIVKEMEVEYPSIIDPLLQEDFSNDDLVEDGTEGIKAGDTSGMNGYYDGKTCSLSNIEIESLVSVVRDLFPELGAGFVKECLKHYNYSSEEVLNAILEQTLPPHLEALDRTLEDAPLKLPEDVKTRPQGEASTTTSDVLVNRLNVYDDDEFDVFKQPTKFDRNRAHKGKRKGVQYEKDPELTEKMKSIIHQYEANQGYSIYEDEEKYSPITSTEYDDEYDDTYDDNDTGDVDNFSDERRRFDRVPNLRGRGALNAPLSFLEEEVEEGENKEVRVVEVNGRREEGNRHEFGENTNWKPTEKLKKANASYKRGYGSREQANWNTSSSAEAMVFTNSSRVPSFGKREDPSPAEGDRGGYKNRTGFEPFCENPEETRRRMEKKRMNKQIRNKGYCSQPSTTSTEDNEGGSQPHLNTSTKANKHSGKAWRQGMQGEDSDNRRQHGGKYKEDTNHGKAQDRTYRHKMTHKNEQRRQAAQAKYRNNF